MQDEIFEAFYTSSHQYIHCTTNTENIGLGPIISPYLV